VERRSAARPSGSDDGTVRLWDVETGRTLRVLEGHTATVTSVAWSADQRLALSGSDDDTVRLWDVETGRSLRVFEGHTARSQAWRGAPISVSPSQALMTTPCDYGIWPRDSVCASSKDTQVESERCRGVPINAMRTPATRAAASECGICPSPLA